MSIKKILINDFFLNHYLETYKKLCTTFLNLNVSKKNVINTSIHITKKNFQNFKYL